MLEGKELHDGKFLKILWDDRSRIVPIDWKETTAEMSDEDFKADLTTFASYVERQKARGILVDVAQFRHQPGPDLQPWRVKNISTRYAAAGVLRFAFLFPPGAQVPPMMNRSSPGENFETRAFNSVDEAIHWLSDAVAT
jgi:hypothetical protein